MSRSEMVRPNFESCWILLLFKIVTIYTHTKNIWKYLFLHTTGKTSIWFFRTVCFSLYFKVSFLVLKMKSSINLNRYLYFFCFFFSFSYWFIGVLYIFCMSSFSMHYKYFLSFGALSFILLMSFDMKRSF